MSQAEQEAYVAESLKTKKEIEFLNTKGVLLQKHLVILHLLVEFAITFLKSKMTLYIKKPSMPKHRRQAYLSRPASVKRQKLTE